MARKRRPNSPLNPFFGHTAQEIADWCGVSPGTAEHYKTGRRKPPTPVLRLWLLKQEERVLDPEFWPGFRVVGNQLFAPGDSRPFRPGHVQTYGLLWQIIAELDRDRYYELLEEASRLLASGD